MNRTEIMLNSFTEFVVIPTSNATVEQLLPADPDRMGFSVGGDPNADCYIGPTNQVAAGQGVFCPGTFPIATFNIWDHGRWVQQPIYVITTGARTVVAITCRRGRK